MVEVLLDHIIFPKIVVPFCFPSSKILLTSLICCGLLHSLRPCEDTHTHPHTHFFTVELVQFQERAERNVYAFNWKFS